MQNFTTVQTLVTQLLLSVDKLKVALQNAELPTEVKKVFSNLQYLTDSFYKLGAVEATQNSVSLVVALAGSCARLGELVSSMVVSNNGDLGQTLVAQARTLMTQLESAPDLAIYVKSSEYRDGRTNQMLFDLEASRLREQITGLEKDDVRLKKRISDNDVRISELESRIKNIEDEASQEISKISELYQKSLRLVDEKQSQINDILGHVSGRAIAGDYENSAADERTAANWLRWGALLMMALIVLVLGVAIADTIANDFKWPQFLSRVSMVFLLSVPAAYLARESAKHRLQQYQHQQTSLDMKAVAPFLASLPVDEQHRIKAAIASRIFGGKDFSKVGDDPYPINTHELLMEIIKKLDTPGKGAGAAKPDKTAV